jgi:cytochrome c-type biogenesis protein
MAEKLPIAFAAGLLSVLTPCVLPLVPGYLAAVSAVDVTALGTRGSVRKVVTSSLPFIAGLTAVFVPLGAGAAAIASVLPKTSQNEIAGFILVVIGLAFMGLLPLPKAIVAPRLLQSARRTGSSALLGGAFAVCAAPCIGTVLGSILVLASSSGTIVRGIILLTAYSLGLGAAFLIAGVAFTRAMRTFRWVRDHFTVVQAFSGSVLVVFGLLLFFHRDFWLRDGLNQLLSHVGLGTL